MIVEELARGWTTVAGVVTAHATAAWTVARSGTSEQRQMLLPAMTRGEILGAAALGEGVTARRDRTDCVLAGTTGLVDNAPRAQLFVTLGRADDGRRALVLLTRGTPGLALGTPEPTLGSRGLDPARLWLDGARVPGAAVLEREDGGEAAVAAALGMARLGLAAPGGGPAQAASAAAVPSSPAPP